MAFTVSFLNACESIIFLYFTEGREDPTRLLDDRIGEQLSVPERSRRSKSPDPGGHQRSRSRSPAPDRGHMNRSPMPDRDQR